MPSETRDNRRAPGRVDLRKHLEETTKLLSGNAGDHSNES